MAIVGLVPLGLSLFTKLPEIWGIVAGLFGAKTPATVVEAGKLAESISSAVSGNQVAPEVMLKMEELFNTHKERMATILMEERKTEMSGILGAQDVEKVASQSSDPIVRQTRPIILRRLTNAFIIYGFAAPAMVVAIHFLKMDDADLTTITEMVKQFFFYLTTAWSIAFTGYNVTRMRENTASGTGNGGIGSFFKGILPFGKK